MKKMHRNIGIGVAAVVVLLLVLPLFIDVDSFRPKIESELSNALGRKVEIGDLFRCENEILRPRHRLKVTRKGDF